jgi:hypothetical protein
MIALGNCTIHYRMLSNGIVCMMQRIDSIHLPLTSLPLFAYYWWASWLLLPLPLTLLLLLLPLTLLAGIAVASYSIRIRVTLPCGLPSIVDVLCVEDESG